MRSLEVPSVPPERRRGDRLARRGSRTPGTGHAARNEARLFTLSSWDANPPPWLWSGESVSSCSAIATVLRNALLPPRMPLPLYEEMKQIRMHPHQFLTGPARPAGIERSRGGLLVNVSRSPHAPLGP